jgi:demethylmacrocin O-methyltransferase
MFGDFMRALLKIPLRWDKRSKEERENLIIRYAKHRYWAFFGASFLVCLFPISLKRLFSFTMSDKETPGGHHYGWAYQKNFRPYKYKRTKILEVGIGGYEVYIGGHSLNSWQCYFPFGRIVAADIQDRTALSNFRTTIHIVDQSNRDSLIKMAQTEGQFDIVVDDGSHMNSHQLLTFHTLFDYVPDGGIYAIEDVQTSYWQQDDWDGAEPESDAFRETCVGYFLRVANYLNHAEFRLGVEETAPDIIALAKRIKSIEFHHNLIFIHKGSNDDPTNRPFEL